jgi:NADH-quinone oxidoreductase subunit M
MATLLVITVMLPLAASLVLAFAPRLDAQEARQIALAAALVTLGFSLVLLLGFRPQLTSPQFVFISHDGRYGLGWLGRPDIRFALGLDGLSLWLFVLTSILELTAIFASWESIKERAPLYYAFLLALETGLLGLFASLDIVLFYVFFEFTLIPLFFLIGLWGGPDRHRAAITFFLYTLAGSLLTLLGVIALVVVHFQYSTEHTLTFSIPELTHGLAALEWEPWHSASSWGSPQVVIFLLLLAGFAIKVPMFPFHTWLPLAHVEAPTAGSIILAGVLLKVGSYGLLRFNLGMTPVAAASLFPLIATLAVIGIIYGALAALAQTDVKRLVAYSSVSHMGFVVLGLFALNSTSLEGSVMQMINHGLATGALFACVGMIYDRYHTREMTELGGLWNRLPVWAFFLILAALASAAVPGLNGFVGEFPILVGVFGTSPRTAVIAASGMILGACYLLWMVRMLVFGPLREPVAGDAPHHGAGAGGEVTDHHLGARSSTIPPVGWHEIAGLAPLLILMVLIGVFPAPFFDQMRPAVAEIIEDLPQSSAARNWNRDSAIADLIRLAFRQGEPAFATARREGGRGFAAARQEARLSKIAVARVGETRGERVLAPAAREGEPIFAGARQQRRPSRITKPDFEARP